MVALIGTVFIETVCKAVIFGDGVCSACGGISELSKAKLLEDMSYIRKFQFFFQRLDMYGKHKFSPHFRSVRLICNLHLYRLHLSGLSEGVVGVVAKNSEYFNQQSKLISAENAILCLHLRIGFLRWNHCYNTMRGSLKVRPLRGHVDHQDQCSQG